MPEPSSSGKTGAEGDTVNDPNAGSQSIDPQGLPANEDDGHVEIFGPSESTSGASDKDPLQTPKADPIPEGEEKPKYTLGEVEFSEEDITRWKQLEESMDPANVQKLEGKHHKRGLELNQQEHALSEREAVLKSREAEVNEVRDLAAEYKAVKELVQKDPQFAQALKERISNPRSFAQLEIEKLRTEMKDENREAAKATALTRLKTDIKGFSAEACKETYESFDFDDPYDLYRALHFIGQGMNLEAEVTKRLAAANQKIQGQPVRPPVAGTTQQPKAKAFKDVDEAADDLMKQLGLST